MYPAIASVTPINDYNKFQKRIILEKQLRVESELVKADSLLILGDFEELGDVD